MNELIETHFLFNPGIALGIFMYAVLIVFMIGTLVRVDGSKTERSDEALEAFNDRLRNIGAREANKFNNIRIRILEEAGAKSLKREKENNGRLPQQIPGISQENRLPN